MKNFALLLVPALLIIAFISLALCNSENVEPPKYSTTVKLDISCQEEIRNQLYSYLSRELRSLVDVKPVEDNPDWAIQVVALQIETKAGYKRGMAFSVVISRRLSESSILKESLEAARQEKLLLQKVISESDSRKSESLLKAANLWHNRSEYLANLSTIHAHWLRISSIEDVQRLCQEIVADFDAEHLKTDREMLQLFQDHARRQEKSKEGSIKEKSSVFDDFKPKNK